MRVSHLYVYPVKSLRGISFRDSEVAARGLRWDRHWMVVDEHGRFLTQRHHPRMTWISTALTPDSLVLSAEGHGAIELSLTPGGPTIEGTVWGWTGPVALVDPGVDRWLTELLETPSRLVAMRPDVRRAAWEGEVAFPDGAPVLVLGEASLASLNEDLAQKVALGRFRPNVVVGGSEPFAEDGWTTIRLGSAELAFASRCARCVMTTIDQATGDRPNGGEPLVTLVRTRLIDGKACFGANYVVRCPGRVAIGDEILPFSGGTPKGKGYRGRA